MIAISWERRVRSMKMLSATSTKFRKLFCSTLSVWKKIERSYKSMLFGSFPYLSRIHETFRILNQCQICYTRPQSGHIEIVVSRAVQSYAFRIAYTRVYMCVGSRLACMRAYIFEQHVFVYEIFHLYGCPMQRNRHKLLAFVDCRSSRLFRLRRWYFHLMTLYTNSKTILPTSILQCSRSSLASQFLIFSNSSHHCRKIIKKVQ